MPIDRMQAERLLAADELALPAVCGQTSRPFVMVVRRLATDVLELVRAVPVGVASSKCGVPVRRADATVQASAQCRGPRSGAIGETFPNPATAFQAFSMNARLDIADCYEGCPYCGEASYFACRNCRLFSCLNKYNRKRHRNHEDVWCEGCRSWRCTCDAGGGDDSIDLTAYGQGGSTDELEGSRRIAGSTTQSQARLQGSTQLYLP
jgi:hypothetical protein